MPSAKTISSLNSGLPAHLDFRLLRETGLTHIQNLSGDLWTDHNSHDPGITLLELLCYALLDLGYRTSHSMPDLLASGENGAGKTVFTPAEILGNAPLTINDYRKLLLDIRGVRNAWLDIAEQAETDLFISCESQFYTPADLSKLPNCKRNAAHFLQNQLNFDQKGSRVLLNGLYKVTLELDPVRPEDEADDCHDDSLSTDRILTEARQLLHGQRNLCEDFLKIDLLADEQIAFCAQLELDPAADPEATLAEMFIRLDRWLSPEPVFYTLRQMLERGKTMEEIFEGRPLGTGQHGFIDLDELDRMRPDRAEIHVSDLLRVLLDAPDRSLRAVRSLTLSNYIGGLPQTTGVDWCLHLTPGYRPVIAPELCQIVVMKDGVPFNFDKKRVEILFKTRLTNARKRRLQPYELDQLPPGGERRAIGDYWSIQHDLPVVFGTGPGTIPDSAPKIRKAQALQLKGYLLFFDQLLANYLGQLSHLPDHFSLLPPVETGGLPVTRFPGNIDSVPDLEKLLRGGQPEANGEFISGEKFRYRRGESIFFPKNAAWKSLPGDKPQYEAFLFFDSPEQRETAIRRLRLKAENGDFEVKIEEDTCKNNLILLPTGIDAAGDELILQSSQTFPSADFDRLPAEAQALSFLFLTDENFRRIDLQEAGRYSFEIVYDPLPYLDTLKKIGEPPAASLERRNRLLDHLLARFAEDFSDYALLQFTTGGQRQPVAELIHDKAHFLADYPAISQRRATGFDYFTNPERLWDTDNITGLERRVARLMGIEQATRHTLAPFFVEKTPFGVRYSVRLRDFRGRTIWESIGPVTNFLAFLETLETQAADPKNYRPTGCETFHRFGFDLLDAAGCPLATHPDFYGNTALRDLKMAHFAAAFSFSKTTVGAPGCHDARFFESPAGWFFSLEKDGKTLARSPQPFATHDDALLGWIHFAELAASPNSFFIQNDGFGNGFSVEIREADGATVAARYPFFFETEKEAQQLALDIQKCLAENDPAAHLSQADGAWNWQFNDPLSGEKLMTGRWPFAAREQADFALLAALEAAQNLAFFEKIAQPDGTWLVVLQNANDLPLADLNGPFANQAEADAAISAAQKAAKPDTLFYRKVGVKNHPLRLRWQADDGQILLEGTRLFRDQAAAETAFDDLLKWAADLKNWRISIENGWKLRLHDPFGELAAECPTTFYDEKSTLETRNELVKTALQKTVEPPVFEKLPQAWFFRLTDQSGEAVLDSTDLFEEKISAQAAFIDALFLARSASNWLAVNGPSKTDFSIVLKAESGRPLAVSMPVFGDAAARDSMLETWKTWFVSPKNAFWLLQMPGLWNFEINPPGQVALENIGSFSTKKEALLAIEKTLELAAQTGNLACENEPGTCFFQLVLNDENGQPLAQVAELFDSKNGCEQAAADLADWLKNHPSPCKLVNEPASWHLDLRWENCADHIETAFADVAGWPKKEDAETAFSELKKLVEADFEALETPDGRWLIRLKNGLPPVVHPQLYDTEAEAKCAVAALADYLRQGLCAWADFRPMRGEFFKVKKDAATLATQPRFFKTEKERDAALLALQQEYACELPPFSTLHLGVCRVEKQGNRWVFVLKEADDCGCLEPAGADGPPLWVSAESYDSKENALAAFDEFYLDILAAAADFANYEPDCSGPTACFYWLKDPAQPGKFLAHTPNLTQIAEAEAKKRVAHARLYPIKKEAPGCFGFQLWDVKTQEPAWLSALVFGSPSEAMTAFENFLARLAWPQNICPTDLPAKPEFGIECCEIAFCEADPTDCPEPGLDAGVYPFQAVWHSKKSDGSWFEIAQPLPAGLKELHLFLEKTDDEQKAEALAQKPTAWERLESCLVAFGDGAELEARLLERADCRFGLEMVGAGYRLARHPQVFHHFSQREAARDCLFGEIRCKILCREAEILAILPKKECLECPPKTDLDWLAKNWKLGLGLLEPDKTGCAPCAQPDLLDPARVVDLMALARAEDCYVHLQDAGGSKTAPGPTAWGLFDGSGNFRACSVFKSDDETELNDWRAAAIRQAWDFPIIRRGDGFAFQLSVGPECVVLEGLETWRTPAAAAAAFCKLLILLKEKAHFVATETDDCGPFGIDIIDPAARKMVHPNSYASRAEALREAVALGDCLDAEGMHVLEHILLRPRSVGSTIFQVECTDCADLKLAEKWTENDPESGILTGNDPYSFWATVVLPYWSRRFRNLRFRQFFEQTLRREAPAHVRLRIAWLAPEQMKKLETAWHAWLRSNAVGLDSCDLESRLKDLIFTLECLENAWPEGSAYGDTPLAEAENLLVLDQSLLTDAALSATGSNSPNNS